MPPGLICTVKRGTRCACGAANADRLAVRSRDPAQTSTKHSPLQQRAAHAPVFTMWWHQGAPAPKQPATTHFLDEIGSAPDDGPLSTYRISETDQSSRHTVTGASRVWASYGLEHERARDGNSGVIPRGHLPRGSRTIGVALSRLAGWRTTIVAAIVVVIVAISGCTPAPSSSEELTSEPGVLVATFDGSVETVTISAPTLDEQALASLSSISSLGAVAIGVPVELSADGAMPSEGATISRSYAAPLPEGAQAAFMWWNGDIGEWEPVASEISADRRVLTANVNHFSIWTDLVAGGQAAIGAVTDAARRAGQAVSEVASVVGQGLEKANATISKAIQTGADHLYFAAGQILSTRADQPQCDGSQPNWVESVIVIEDSPANPLRFCVGSGVSNTAVVKVAANRGYAIPYALAGTATVQGTALTAFQAIQSIVDLDATIANSVADLTNSGKLIFPGESITVNVSRDDIAAANGETLFSGRVPSVWSWAMSAVAARAVDQAIGLDTSIVGILLQFAICGRDAANANDPGPIVKAVVGCVKAEPVIAQVFESLGISDASKQAKKIAAKIGIHVLVIGGAFETMGFLADANLPPNAYALDVIAKSYADRWIVSSEGIGPARFADGLDSAEAALGDKILDCRGERGRGGRNGPWVVTIWGGGGGDSKYMYVLALNNEDVPSISDAPITETGVTIGTPESELINLGYTKTESKIGPGYPDYTWQENNVQLVAGVYDGLVYGLGVGTSTMQIEYCA